MADSWFDEYMYQIMIDRKYVPASGSPPLSSRSSHSNLQDPMGALAGMR